MLPTMQQLSSVYGLPEAAAYRMLSEVANGASTSVALHIAITQTRPLPTNYGGLYLPPEAYNAKWPLKAGGCPTCVSR